MLLRYHTLPVILLCFTLKCCYSKCKSEMILISLNMVDNIRLNKIDIKRLNTGARSNFCLLYFHLKLLSFSSFIFGNHYLSLNY